ncbi:MAG: DUF45 domain-containing protein [Bacteroidales bacterium]|nr:DUF45 domain-containing protein [Bacteroidales bacterium]
MLKDFNDSQLGLIKLNVHPTAIKFIFRATENGIKVTVPKYASLSEVKKSLNSMRDELLKLKAKKSQRTTEIKDGYTFEGVNFKLKIDESINGSYFQSSYRNGIFTIHTPIGIDYNTEETRLMLEKISRDCLRFEAERYLPFRAAHLAKEKGLAYNSCAVSFGKQRLGRCDSNKNILLSYKLMMLPQYLSDYVILHEFAHLSEMNHGPLFHNLLNIYCNGKHRQLERELKEFKYPFM